METKKIIIAGPRDYTNKSFVYSEITRIIEYILLKNNKTSIEIVEGGAKGVDAIAAQYSRDSSKVKKHTCFEADWDSYGRSAGPIRNQNMAEYSDILLAFRYKRKPSRGTENMIKTALDYGLEVHVVQLPTKSS